MKTIILIGMLAISGTALATDVINQDAKSYKVTIVDGGYTETKTVGAHGSVYGLCGSGPCTFSIKGSKLAGVGKNDRIVISGGVIKHQ